MSPPSRSQGVTASVTRSHGPDPAKPRWDRPISGSQEFGVAWGWARIHEPPHPRAQRAALPGGGEYAAVAPAAPVSPPVLLLHQVGSGWVCATRPMWDASPRPPPPQDGPCAAARRELHPPGAHLRSPPAQPRHQARAGGVPGRPRGLAAARRGRGRSSSEGPSGSLVQQAGSSPSPFALAQ